MARRNTPETLGRSEDIEASGRTRRRTRIGSDEGLPLGRRLRAKREERQARHGMGGGQGPDVRTHVTTSGVYSPAQQGMAEEETPRRGRRNKTRMILGLGGLTAGMAAGFWYLRRRGRDRERW